LIQTKDTAKTTTRKERKKTRIASKQRLRVVHLFFPREAFDVSLTRHQIDGFMFKATQSRI
jgi:hypothetical protein